LFIYLIVSVTFIEESSEVPFLQNDLEEIFEPNNEETTKLRELLKKRRPTPYSKSTRKTEETDEEDDEEKRLLNEGFEDYGTSPNRSLSQVQRSF